MDIVVHIKEEHDRLRRLASMIANEDKDAKKRRAWFKEFKVDITKHARAEERVLYVALDRLHTDKALEFTTEGTVEHHLMDYVIAAMAKSRATTSPQWTAHAKVVKDLLEHHLDEEEDEMFKMLRKRFTLEQRHAMHEKFEARRRLVHPKV